LRVQGCVYVIGSNVKIHVYHGKLAAIQWHDLVFVAVIPRYARCSHRVWRNGCNFAIRSSRHVVQGHADVGLNATLNEVPRQVL